MKKTVALLLISLALFLGYVTTVVLSQASTNETVIDDFEAYTVGQKLAGQGAWIVRPDCNITVENADASWTGKILRSGSCANGQLTEQNYAFQFTPQMHYAYLQFSGRMTSGSGGNSCTRLEISSPNEAFVFGTNHVPTLSINHRLYMAIPGAGDIYGPGLTPGTWYDFRLEIDWSYQSAQNKYGLANLKYRPSGSTTWLSDPAFSNLELNVLDPTQFNRLGVRMDGLSSRRGEMDNILIGRQSQADLALSKSQTPAGNVLPGQAITYTLVYTNNGPDAASGIVITDIVPITITNLSFSSTGATITQVVGSSYVFQVADLIAGQGGTINITGVISPGLTTNTFFTNTATITTTAIDTATTNNLALVNTIVTRKQADLALSKSQTPAGNVLPGQAITYTLVYTNNGPDAASGIVITDIVPITVTNLNFSSTGATITPVVGSSYVFQVTDLIAGQGGTINITGVISPGLTANTLFANTATITTTTLDTNITNNLALVNTIVTTKRDNLYLPLVLKDYLLPVFPLYIGSAIPQRPVTHQGEIFYTSAVQVPGSLPVGGHFYFSSGPGTLTEVVIDDKIALLSGGNDLFSYNFSGSGSPQATTLQVPRSIMEQLAGHTITVEYRDVYSGVVAASPMWLIWLP